MKDLKNKMAALRTECMLPHNLRELRVYDNTVDYNSTNLQLFQAIGKLNCQLYLLQDANSILIDFLCKNNISKEFSDLENQINLL